MPLFRILAVPKTPQLTVVFRGRSCWQQPCMRDEVRSALCQVGLRSRRRDLPGRDQEGAIGSTFDVCEM